MTIPTRAKMFIRAELPTDLEQAFLQHIRDFDVDNPGCRFQVMSDPVGDLSFEEIIGMIQVDPNLTFTQIFDRKKN